MIDNYTLNIIGFFIMFASTAIAFVFLFHFEKDRLGFGILIGGLSIGIILVLTAVIIQEHEDQIKQAQEKLRIDSLSCQALGEYVLNNADNYTYSDGSIKNHNFVYAQTKFLVCTHSLISRLSP